MQADVHSRDEQLPCAVLALNCSYHPSIKNVPYYLFHGRDPPIKYSALLDNAILNYSLEDNSAQSVFARLQQAFKDAEKASKEAHDLNARAQKSKYYSFKLGDTVFLSNDSKRRAPYSKFQPKWIGPFRISMIISEENVQITSMHNKSKKQIVHVNRLKPAKLSDENPYIYMQPETGTDENLNMNKTINPDPSDTDSSDESDEEYGNPILIMRRKPNDKRPDTTKSHSYALRSRGPVDSHSHIPSSSKMKALLNIAVIVFIYVFCLVLR